MDIKAKFDCAWHNENNKLGGVGVVFRNENGQFLAGLK